MQKKKSYLKETSQGCFLAETQSLRLLYSTQLSVSQTVHTATALNDIPLQQLS